jgi:hypothetical protein
LPATSSLRLNSPALAQPSFDVRGSWAPCSTPPPTPTCSFPSASWCQMSMSAPANCPLNSPEWCLCPDPIGSGPLYRMMTVELFAGETIYEGLKRTSKFNCFLYQKMSGWHCGFW